MEKNKDMVPSASPAVLSDATIDALGDVMLDLLEKDGEPVIDNVRGFAREIERRALLAAQPAEPAPMVPAGILDALRFYANGSHFTMHDSSAWDTVSGEPPNFYEDESNTATVEDGSIAKLALQGKFFTDTEYQEPAVEGEVYGAAPAEPARADRQSVALLDDELDLGQLLEDAKRPHAMFSAGIVIRLIARIRASSSRAKVERDAERYQWMLAHLDTHRLWQRKGAWFCLPNNATEGPGYSTADAAIDAAEAPNAGGKK